MTDSRARAAGNETARTWLVAAIVGLALVTGAVLLAGGFNLARMGSTSLAGTSSGPLQVSPNERIARLQVSNMYCISCPYIVERALRSAPGVIDASVSLRDRRAVVRFDSTRTGVVDLIQVTAAIGYPSRVVSN